jgi:hypothetical protein
MTSNSWLSRVKVTTSIDSPLLSYDCNEEMRQTSCAQVVSAFREASEQ